jgi:signal peptidase II
MVADVPQTPSARPAERWPTIIFMTAAVLVIVLDQISKWLVVTHMTWGQSVPPEGIFRFTYVRNTGGAFGLFQGQNGALMVTAVIGALALLLLYLYRGSQSNLLRLILGMQLGGAIGNLVDRVRLGYVVDFFDWGFWPVFNVADASITVSIILLVGYMLLSSGKTPAATPARREQQAPPP